MTTTEIAIPEQAGAELVDAELVPQPSTEPLTEKQARDLDKKIRSASDRWVINRNKLLDLLDEAARGEIHVALGYSSWTAYVEDAVQLHPADRDERKAFVQLMAEKGMSQRAIAGTLGIDQKTVSNDLRSTEENSSPKPDKITTLNGKLQTSNRKPKSKPEPEPKPDNNIIDAEEAPVPEPEVEAEPEQESNPADDFSDEMDRLLINVQAFKDILGDERFPKARNQIAKRHLDPLNGAVGDLQRVKRALAGSTNVDGADAT